jgi:hypothetical protein
MNFGTPAVGVRMLIYRWLLGLARRYMLRISSDPVRVSIYAAFVGMMPHCVRGELVRPTALFLILAIPLWVVWRLVRCPEPRLTFETIPGTEATESAVTGV